MSVYVRAAGVALPVEPSRFTGLVSRAVLSLAVFGLPLAMALARIFETPASLLGWSRFCVSLAAIAIIVVARRREFAQRVLLAFVLEAGSGVATFAYVDLPFVMAHTVAIADGTASMYERLTNRDLVTDLKGLPIGP